ncbi:MAG: carboxypeptidase-like regulatory domain-containing protein [Myxococcota bacterium]|nr:carboxypeptidase-like regulatory domain-containing protein [Myxococcota bacterium]
MSRMLFGFAAVAVAFVAGRFTAPEVAAKPVVTIEAEKQVEMITLHCPSEGERVVEIEDEPYEDPDAIEAEDTEAVRMLENESKRIATLEAGLGPQGALRGQIRDVKTGELLIGVTVVATIGTDSSVAITDENGWYEIAPLPEGTYTVTLYYAESAVEHAGVAVAARRVTPLFGKIDSAPNGEVIMIGHGHGITIDLDSTQNVTSGRTFEGVLGSSATVEDSEDPDSAGVSFNGSEATEYYD